MIISKRSAMMALSLLVAAARLKSEPASEHLSTLEKRIDDTIHRAVNEGFSGAILVQDRGQIVLDKGYGKIQGVAMTSDTRFWLASLGKQFTAAAILKCQDKGWLTLNDPITRFISAVPQEKKGINIKQLLAHQSGLASTNVSETATNRAEAVAGILSQPLADRPGARFIYANDNYQLAAAIVEIASKSRYEDFVFTELFKPISLDNTGQIDSSRDPKVAPVKGKRPKRLSERKWGQQGYYSTTQDLLSWYNALRAAKILSKKSVDEMFQPTVKIQEGFAALGWFLGTTDKGTPKIFDRGNEDFGANSLIYSYPETDTVVIVLTHAGNKNEDQSWSRAVHAEIERILFHDV